jgi:hypothetical protein
VWDLNNHCPHCARASVRRRRAAAAGACAVVFLGAAAAAACAVVFLVGQGVHELHRRHLPVCNENARKFWKSKMQKSQKSGRKL